MKPVPAAAAGHFEERAVARGLGDRFAAIWMHRMPRDGAPPVIITPDATIDLQWIDGTLRIAGPDREPQTEIIPAGATVIGFRFRPALAASWLGIPAHELVGKRIDLEDLWGAKARRLADRIDAGQHGGGTVAALETALAEFELKRPTDTAMAAAFTFIEAGPPPGARLVPWLARSLAMSERTLRRRFDESFGYGPKTLDRILRYQRFIKLSQSTQSPIAAVAIEAGYTDQAHLTRESRLLSGITPDQHRRSLKAG